MSMWLGRIQLEIGLLGTYQHIAGTWNSNDDLTDGVSRSSLTCLPSTLFPLPETVPALVNRFVTLLQGQPDAETMLFLPFLYVYMIALA